MIMDQTRKMRVLVVDDDLDLSHMLAKRLAAHDFEVEERSHGLGVISILAGWDENSPQPDITILDNFMPEISGAAILGLAARTASARHIPIILYSANGDIRHEVEALGHPHAVFIVKGKPSEVIEAVLHFRNHGQLPGTGAKPEP